MDYVITIWNHTNLCATIGAIVLGDNVQFDPAASLQTGQHVSAWGFLCARIVPNGTPDEIAAEVRLHYDTLWLRGDDELGRASGGVAAVRFGWRHIPRQARSGYIGARTSAWPLKTSKGAITATVSAFFGDVQVYLSRRYRPPRVRVVRREAVPVVRPSVPLDELDRL